MDLHTFYFCPETLITAFLLSKSNALHLKPLVLRLRGKEEPDVNSLFTLIALFTLSLFLNTKYF